MSYEITILPKSGFGTSWKEIQQYRELLYFFTWKDIKVRYKQAFLGVLWTVLQPLAMMVIFVLLFNKGLGISTGSIPAPLYYLAGLILWNLFSQAVNGAAQSMVTNANIIKKIYFPRLIIPISSVLTATFDFLISLILFLAIAIFYKISEGFAFPILYLLAGFIISYLITAVTAFGLGTLLSAINVKYRDVRYALPFLIQALFFVTPVMYDVQSLNNQWLASLLELNPLYFAIRIIRECLLTGSLEYVLTVPIMMIVVLILVYICGIFVFKKTEAYFADIV